VTDERLRALLSSTAPHEEEAGRRSWRVVSDAFGTVRVWNPAAVRMFGWTEEETIGHPNPLLSPEGDPELRARLAKFKAGQETEVAQRAARLKKIRERAAGPGR